MESDLKLLLLVVGFGVLGAVRASVAPCFMGSQLPPWKLLLRVEILDDPICTVLPEFRELWYLKSCRISICSRTPPLSTPVIGLIEN